MDRRRLLTWMGAGVAVLAIAVFALWWFLLRSTAPPAVSLDAAVDAATSTTGAGEAATTAPAPTVDIEGTWVVGGDSFVGYRVNEELANIGVTTAAGRTSDVTGSIEIDAAGTIEGVTISANLLTLQSDNNRRDGAIKRQALETETFPEAGFDLQEPIALPPAAAAGEAFEVQANGQFLLHGTSRNVTIPLQAQLVGDTIVVVGSMEVAFADYGIEQPSAVIVLSVEDVGIMEFQLIFTRES